MRITEKLDIIVGDGLVDLAASSMFTGESSTKPTRVWFAVDATLCDAPIYFVPHASVSTTSGVGVKQGEFGTVGPFDWPAGIPDARTASTVTGHITAAIERKG